MDVNLNVGLYWLLIYTIVSFTDCTEPTRCHQEHYIPCGDDKTPCQTVLCLVKNNYNVDKINAIKHTENCKSNVGYDGEHVWTTDCCRIVAHVCYRSDTSSFIPSTTTVTTMNNNNTTATSTASAPVSDTDSPATTVRDKLDGSIAIDMIYRRRFAPGSGNVFSPIANNSLETIIEKVTPLVKVEGRNKESSSVGLYVGAALGIVTILVVIATVCFIFRKKLKRPILWRKSQKNSREDLSFPVYQSPDNISFPCKTFSNPEYGMTLETMTTTQIFHFPAQISDNSAHCGVNQINERHPKHDCVVSNEAKKADLKNETEPVYNRPCTDLSASFGSDHVYDRTVQAPPNHPENTIPLPLYDKISS